MKSAWNTCSKYAGTRVLAILILMVSGPQLAPAAQKKPNVVIVMTDDQGYGDLGCHGHPFVKTPNLDKLYAESTRLTDFHVMPLCAPTRAMLMTGRNPLKDGVWATVLGRSILPENSKTMASHFAANGYATGMFGKWHLGDNYPSRPHDKGFKTALYHGGGGVGQTPDFWGNDYLDDTYFLNGKPLKKAGYCTDVWFDAAFEFIRENRQKPFLTYIATNAPHAPYVPPENLADNYRAIPGIDPATASFYAMIENIDSNIGRLTRFLSDQGLDRDTILIFMTDNGTAQGLMAPGAFNAGMKGSKGTLYEGGHRVPCFIRWPGGDLPQNGKGRDCKSLTTAADLLPTLATLTGIKLLEHSQPLDGKDISQSIKGDSQKELLERTLFIQFAQTDAPPKRGQALVLTQKWRWINHRELYDIENDPRQILNVASKYPEIVENLSQAYDQWFSNLEPVLQNVNRIKVGSDQENPCRLNAMDWHMDGSPANLPWNQPSIRKGLIASGAWAIEVESDGAYEFKLMRWPEESNLELNRSSNQTGQNRTIAKARLTVGNTDMTQSALPGDMSITMKVNLKKGPQTLKTEFMDSDGKSLGGAYYVSVSRKTP